MFELIPAIDVSGGRLARLTARGPVPVEAFGGDPVGRRRRVRGRRRHAAARRRPGSGRRGLGAEPRRRSRPSPVWAFPSRRAGAPPSRPRSISCSSAGAERVVLGSAALADHALVEELVERFGAGSRSASRPTASGSARGGAARSTCRWPRRSRGWPARLRERFVVTGVPRVGGLAGPDLDGLRAVLALRRPTIGAGGIASLDDVLAMRDAGAEGAIVGRAALEGSLEPAAVLRALVAAEDAGPDGAGRESRRPLDSVPPMGFLTDLVAEIRRDLDAPSPRRRRAARARRRPAAGARSGRGAPLARARRHRRGEAGVAIGRRDRRPRPGRSGARVRGGRRRRRSPCSPSRATSPARSPTCGRSRMASQRPGAAQGFPRASVAADRGAGGRRRRRPAHRGGR